MQEQVKIIPGEILKLLFISHLDITVPDKTLDGDEQLFFEGEVGFYKFVKGPDCPKRLQKFQARTLS